MSGIEAIEHERRMTGGSTDPMQLRQRMLIEPEPDQISDDDILTVIYQMDEEDRWRALQVLPDADIERLFTRMNDE